MNDKYLPFSLPDIGEEEIAEVVDTLRSGWLTTGPKVRRFEEDFASFIGKGVKSVAVSSATSGLHLALEAAGVKSGDRVITSPYTFTATAEAIRYLGADPVFSDIQPDTFNIDPSKVEELVIRSLQRGTGAPARLAAVVPVHFAGLSCDMDGIARIAKKYDLRIIEDAAHSLPATYKGKIIGSLNTDATVYSFYATKTIAAGEGGMIVTRSPEIADRCRLMRLHGIRRDVSKGGAAAKPSWYYEVIEPGYKYNMTDITAAIGIHQLKKAWKFQKKRAEIAAAYNAAFADLPVLLPPMPALPDVHAWHLYVLRLEETGISRDVFIEKMHEKGIGCSVHFMPLHLHPYWRKRYNLKPDDFPNALRLFNQSVSLPIYTRMTVEEIERVIRGVRDILL